MGKWFDPKLAPDDKEVYGFTNCMKKVLDSGLDCARRLDRQREREREREVNQPGSWLPYESADLNVVPGATGVFAGSSSGPGILPASSLSPDTGPSKPRIYSQLERELAAQCDQLPGQCINDCGTVTSRRDSGGCFCCINCAKLRRNWTTAKPVEEQLLPPLFRNWEHYYHPTTIVGPGPIAKEPDGNFGPPVPLDELTVDGGDD